MRSFQRLSTSPAFPAVTGQRQDMGLKADSKLWPLELSLYYIYLLRALIDGHVFIECLLCARSWELGTDLVFAFLGLTALRGRGVGSPVQFPAVRESFPEEVALRRYSWAGSARPKGRGKNSVEVTFRAEAGMSLANSESCKCLHGLECDVWCGRELRKKWLGLPDASAGKGACCPSLIPGNTRVYCPLQAVL